MACANGLQGFLWAVLFLWGRDYTRKGNGMADETPTSIITQQMPHLAKLALAGVRTCAVFGKVKSIRPTTSQSSGLQQMKAEVICGEGDTITLKWPMGASVPGVGHEGFFLIGKPSEYMNKASADCIGFA